MEAFINISNLPPLTLEELRKHQWVGNHYHDMPMFTRIHEFVLDERNSVEDRAKALWIMGRDGMGLDPKTNEEHLTPHELLRVYRSACS
jgi:hypothetical protein